jgi:hypothetical protein
MLNQDRSLRLRHSLGSRLKLRHLTLLQAWIATAR